MYLYSAFIVVRHTQGAQVRITQCCLQITPYLPLRRKHSPDGASPDWGCGHLTAAYYSFIYPDGMKGWVGLVGWPTADGLSTSPVSCRSSAGQRKFAGQRPTFYRCATQLPNLYRKLNFCECQMKQCICYLAHTQMQAVCVSDIHRRPF